MIHKKTINTNIYNLLQMNKASDTMETFVQQQLKLVFFYSSAVITLTCGHEYIFFYKDMLDKALMKQN